MREKLKAEPVVAPWQIEFKLIGEMGFSWRVKQKKLIIITLNYGGWKKSCTTLDGWNPVNNGINHLSTGAGFLPSTVVLHCIAILIEVNNYPIATLLVIYIDIIPGFDLTNKIALGFLFTVDHQWIVVKIDTGMTNRRSSLLSQWNSARLKWIYTEFILPSGKLT